MSWCVFMWHVYDLLEGVLYKCTVVSTLLANAMLSKTISVNVKIRQLAAANASILSIIILLIF